MPQTSRYQIPIPDTDVLTWLFHQPPSCAPSEASSDQPIYVSAVDPRKYSLSPSQALLWIKRFAVGLQGLDGFGHGDVVMMFSPNHVFVPVGYLGAIASGGIFCGCSSGFGVSEAQYQLQNTGAKVMLVHPRLIDTALAAAEKAGLRKDRVFLFDEEESQETRGVKDFRTMMGSVAEAERWQWKKLNGEEARNTTAVLNYSSGTTGLPKGVRISHTNLIANVTQSLFMRDLQQPYNPSTRPPERWLGFLPLTHAYGQLWTILGALKTRSPVYIMHTFNYVSFLSHIQTHRITHLQTAPPVLVMLAKRPETAKYDLSSLRNILCGAAPLSKELQNEVTALLRGGKVVQTWGMTEVTCSALHVPGGMDDRSGSVGLIDPNCEIKLLNDEGVEVAPGERGEIFIKGPNICQGYWRNEEATNGVFDKDGFMSTGDVAIRDGKGEGGGWFWIVDRKKELIKVKGLQVAPAELEALLLEHEGVADAAVVGVSRGDDGSVTFEGEEYPRAYVVLKEGARGKIDATQIMEWMKGRVARHKQFTGGIRFIEEVPKSVSGKIQRRVIRGWVDGEREVRAKL